MTATLMRRETAVTDFTDRKGQDTATIHFVVPSETKRTLEAIARLEKSNVSAIIRDALVLGCDLRGTPITGET